MRRLNTPVNQLSQQHQLSEHSCRGHSIPYHAALRAVAHLSDGVRPYGTDTSGLVPVIRSAEWQRR